MLLTNIHKEVRSHVKNLHLRDCKVDVILHVSVNAAISNDCEQQDQPTSTEFRTNMKSRHFQASEITIIVAYGVWFYSENPKQNESERRGQGGGIARVTAGDLSSSKTVKGGLGRISPRC